MDNKFNKGKVFKKTVILISLIFGGSRSGDPARIQDPPPDPSRPRAGGLEAPALEAWTR